MWNVIPWYNIDWEVRAVLGGSKRAWLGLGARSVWVVGFREARAASLLRPCALCVQDRKDSPFPRSSPLPRDSHPTPVPTRASSLLFPGMVFGLRPAWAVLTHHSDWRPSLVHCYQPITQVRETFLDMSHIIMLLFYKVSWARKSSTCIC